MNSKSLLIAIAAFAVTATGAQAYVGSEVLSRAGLSIEQIDAFEEARTLRASGDVRKARDVLVEAGLDTETMAQVRAAALTVRAQLREALDSGNYTQFKAAIVGTPLADIITTEADFILYKEAHDLKLSGAHREAQEILADLGVTARGHGHHGYGKPRNVLSDEQKDALQAARQANDRETVRAILDEAGAHDGWGMAHKMMSDR